MIIKGLTEDDKPNFTTHLVYAISSSNFRFNQHSIKLDINNFVLNNFSYLYFPIILKKSKFYYTSELYTSIKHSISERISNESVETNPPQTRLHPSFSPPKKLLNENHPVNPGWSSRWTSGEKKGAETLKGANRGVHSRERGGGEGREALSRKLSGRRPTTPVI